MSQNISNYIYGNVHLNLICLQKYVLPEEMPHNHIMHIIHTVLQFASPFYCWHFYLTPSDWMYCIVYCINLGISSCLFYYYLWYLSSCWVICLLRWSILPSRSRSKCDTDICHPQYLVYILSLEMEHSYICWTRFCVLVISGLGNKYQ